MKTLQRIHTLKELVDLIRAMPAQAFDDEVGIQRVRNELEYRRRDWLASDEYANKIHDESKALERRREREQEKLINREQKVKEWLATGQLVKGTFIKVTGTRDGFGIRELYQVSNGNLVCRQWMRCKKSVKDNVKSLILEGWLQLDGDWIYPTAFMTTHYFSRVVKILDVS